MDYGHNKIPSNKDFARAQADDLKRSVGLNEVRERLLTDFSNRGIHEALPFFSQNTNRFVVHVFCELNRQIPEFLQSGNYDELREVIFDELNRAGRGNRCDINLSVEIDSHENVVSNYDGDYYTRLR